MSPGELLYFFGNEYVCKFDTTVVPFSNASNIDVSLAFRAPVKFFGLGSREKKSTYYAYVDPDMIRPYGEIIRKGSDPIPITKVPNLPYHLVVNFVTFGLDAQFGDAQTSPVYIVQRRTSTSEDNNVITAPNLGVIATSQMAYNTGYSTLLNVGYYGDDDVTIKGVVVPAYVTISMTDTAKSIDIQFSPDADLANIIDTKPVNVLSIVVRDR